MRLGGLTYVRAWSFMTYLIELLVITVSLLLHNDRKHHWLDDFVNTVLKPELVLLHLLVLLLGRVMFFIHYFRGKVYYYL